MPLNTITLRTSTNTLDLFNDLFQESGANSKGEFLNILLDKYRNTEEPQIIQPGTPVEFQPSEKIIEVERTLAEDEILIKLNDAQLFTLKESVLGEKNHAEIHNRFFDKLRSGKAPFIYLGNLYDPEFAPVWTDCKVPKSADDIEAIKHNMAALVLNAFMFRIIENEVRDYPVNSSILKNYLVSIKEKEDES